MCATFFHLYVIAESNIGAETQILSHRPWCRTYASGIWVNIGPGNGLSPDRPLFITETALKMLPAKWLQICFGLNLLTHEDAYCPHRKGV